MARQAPERPQQRANLLLDRILRDYPASLADLAEALVTTPDVIRAYQRGLLIPIERQMLLAAYAIERTPQRARLGYQLRGQIRATIAFAARETETHDGPPPATHSRWFLTSSGGRADR